MIMICVVLAALSLISIVVPKSNIWANTATQISTLHDLGFTGSDVTIGIVDTGVDASHQEFDSNSFLSWNDIINQESYYYDDEDHGTHLAGLLVSQGSFEGVFSGIKMHGLAMNAKIIVTKAIPKNQYLYVGGNDSTIAGGIQFCIDNDADIILLSMGMSPDNVVFHNTSKTSEIIEKAIAQGIFIVAPAGNDRQDDDSDVCFPSILEDVISVGAISKGNTLSSFSSKGHQYPGSVHPNKKPELVAPGEEIISTRINGAYGKLSGTSQAATYVTGILALLLEAYPEYKHDGEKNQNETTIHFFKEIFAKTAKKIGSLQKDDSLLSHDDSYGYGLIQAFDAYKELAKY
jgi:subtilisin family serine protease